jgi:hypothetical protein
MSLETKIEETLSFIRASLKEYVNPVLNCSFGKDSMVLLHLLYSNQMPMHVVYYRDPYFPRKNRFANRVIDEWNLAVHDYPPAKVSLLHSPAMVALVSEYQSGLFSSIAVLKNTIEYQDGENPLAYLCGVDFLCRPCGSFIYPWDACLIAHKDCDTDPIYGIIPLHSRIVMRDEGPDCVFPLKEWTHDEVWDYTEKFGVPFQEDRYDIKNRTEWPDKTFNSDWYPVCVRCVDKRKAGETVFCPKLNREIKNVSDKAPEFGSPLLDYFGARS